MKSGKGNFYRFLVFFSVTGIFLMGLWFWWNESVSPVDSKNSSPILFSVEKGEGIKSIAANLEKVKLIHSPTAFYLLVKLKRMEKKLQAGEYRLNQSMDADTIANELTHGILDVWVTTYEGWRSEEIATELAKDLYIPESEFLKYSVEGYMFPDTYLIPRDATASGIAQIFLDNFHGKITDKMRSDVTKNGLTLEKAVILASIVEREGKSETDRPVIAGILYNRLEKGMPLQADATLQYMLGYEPFEKTWWRKTLLDADKKVESPYNTYLNTGLPPAPISNPGLSAINAVIYPAKTDYLYYLHDESGQVHYSETLEGHNLNISKFLH